MPVHVDVDERLDAIARATITVARREGAASVTIRGVATELGGSTARVTNYIKNRTALIGDGRRPTCCASGSASATRSSRPSPAAERLLDLVRWAVIAEPDDLIFRQLLVELMSQPTATEPAYLAYAHQFRDELATAASRRRRHAPPARRRPRLPPDPRLPLHDRRRLEPPGPAAVDAFLQAAAALLAR